MSIKYELARAVALGCLLAALGACASSRSPGLEPADLPPLVSKLDARIVWKASVGSAQGEALQPAATDDAIYAASASGALVRLDPRNGQEVWRVDTQQRIASGVGTDGDTVVVATSRGQVLAYGADGQHRWTAQATSDVMSPALVGHGLVIVRATDQRISAFEVKTGQKRWVYQREQPPLTLRAVSDMRFIQNLLVVGFPQGRLVGIALADGSLLWEAPVAQPSGSTEVERLADVVGPIAVDQRDICAATFQGRIVCIDAERGALRWARPLSALSGVLIDGESVIVIDENSHVLAYARSTGASLWVNQQLHRRGLTAAVRIGPALAVGEQEGYIHFLSPSDGALIERIRLDSSPILAPPQLAAGLMVVQTQDGVVAALSVQP